MERPELKEFSDLNREDFDRHPVWIGCHGVDSSERWYEDTDEQTFRPWTDNWPAPASEGMLLVKATFELRDGTTHQGFITPALHPGDLSTQQPYIFVGDQCFGFWGGLFGIPIEDRQSFYAAVGASPDKIFPLRFSAEQTLATGETSGEVEGFYQSFGDGTKVDADHSVQESVRLSPAVSGCEHRKSVPPNESSRATVAFHLP